MGLASYRTSTGAAIEYQSGGSHDVMVANAVAQRHPAGDVETRVIELAAYLASLPAVVRPTPPLDAEELFDMLKDDGTDLTARRPRPKP